MKRINKINLFQLKKDQKKKGTKWNRMNGL